MAQEETYPNENTRNKTKQNEAKDEGYCRYGTTIKVVSSNSRREITKLAHTFRVCGGLIFSEAEAEDDDDDDAAAATSNRLVIVMKMTNVAKALINFMI